MGARHFLLSYFAYRCRTADGRPRVATWWRHCQQSRDLCRRKHEEMKKSMVQLVEEKGSKKIEKNEGIKSYEILSEEIDENGEKAKVTAKIVYGNDTEEEQTIELRKAENGQWLLSTGK